jgi:hypothetical protein
VPKIRKNSKFHANFAYSMKIIDIGQSKLCELVKSNSKDYRIQKQYICEN